VTLKNDEVLYSVADHVATITLNRPEKLNAWTVNMESEYRAAFAEAANDPEVRVVLVTGAGRGFCAGADMSLLQSVMSGKVTRKDVDPGELTPEIGRGARDDFTKRFSFPLAVPKPVIGAINGSTAGLGLVLALYCDIRFAADTAKFTTAFSQRGLIAEYGLAWLLPRLIGMHNALDLLFSARVILGTEAYELGLVNKVVPVDRLMEIAREYAIQLATMSSPRSMGVMKRMAYTGQLQTLGEAYDLAVDEMVQSLGSDDFREGVASFLEKRNPTFQPLK
jgi:enoyl-CoA hydratase/carnithine racemase